MLIQHGSVVGQAEMIHVQLEEREEAENHASIRRIYFCTKDPGQGTKPKRHKWDLHIGDQGGAYKTASCESMKMKPNQQPMVREVHLPGEWICGSTNACDGEDITTYSENVDFLKARLQHAHKSEKNHIDYAITRSNDLTPFKGVNAPRWVMRGRRQLSRSRSSE